MGLIKGSTPQTARDFTSGEMVGGGRNPRNQGNPYVHGPSTRPGRGIKGLEARVTGMMGKASRGPRRSRPPRPSM